MVIVTPTDRHKSVRNRFVIDVFVAFLCQVAFLIFSVSVGAFVIVRSLLFSLQVILIFLKLKKFI